MSYYYDRHGKYQGESSGLSPIQKFLGKCLFAGIVIVIIAAMSNGGKKDAPSHSSYTSTPTTQSSALPFTSNPVQSAWTGLGTSVSEVKAAATPSPSVSPEVVSSPAPTTVATPARVYFPGTYRVARVASNDRLNVRNAPDGDTSKVMFSLPPFSQVRVFGTPTKNDRDLWVQIETPSGGTGWVNSVFLQKLQ